MKTERAGGASGARRRAAAWLALALLGCTPAPSSEPAAGAASAATGQASSSGAGEASGAASAPAPSAAPGAGAPPASASASSAASATSAAASGPGSARPRPRPLAAGLGAPSVELLAPGAEPRVALRYEFQAGRVERLRMLNTTSVKTRVAGAEGPAPASPELEFIAKLQIEALLPERRARRSLVFESLEVRPSATVSAALAAKIAERLSGLEQLRGTDVVDDRGVLHEANLDTSAVSSPELKAMVDAMTQSFGQMGAPFPEAPVGVGASWKTKSRITQGGVTITQIATYELLERTERGGKLALRLQQRVPRTKMATPNLPAGTRAELISLEATGQGQLEFELSRAIPRGQIESTSRMLMRTTLARETQDVEITTTVRVGFTPLD